MRKVLFGSLLILLIMTLWGCGDNTQRPISANIVKSIVVTSESDNTTTQRYYDTPEKMRLYLMYIRSVSGRLNADVDPQVLPGRTVHIITFNADNTQKEYYQKNDRYFQKDGRWTQIDPELGAKLWQLILTVPSDSATGNSMPTSPAP